MNYEELISNINLGKIKKVAFCVEGYSHYKNCLIETKRLGSKDSLLIISIHLTRDGYEEVGFIGKFKEKAKIFDLKGKGKFTLKEMWKNIVISGIEEQE